MKKLCLAAAAVLIAILSVGASIWEGAAAVSISGELPEGGYYAATKSFPRNTVVDITNLESGKTVRVIVASGLDSPGLLAILSKEAADVIGIQPRSIGRIRITMPSDPIAFSRFTEGIVPKGDPDHDPQAAIAGTSPRTAPQNQNPQQSAPRSIIPPGTAVVSGSIPPVWEGPNPPSSSTAPTRPVTTPIIPPSKEESPQNSVLWPWEQPDLSSPDRPTTMNPALSGEPAYGSPPDPYRFEGTGEITPAHSSEPAYGFPPDPYLAGQAGDPAYDSAGTTPFLGEWPEETPPPVASPESAYRPPVAAQQDSAITHERGPELTGKPGSETVAAAPKSLVMEPAEERPPEAYITLPPEAEIAPISSPPVNASAPQKEDTIRIPEEYILPEMAAAPRSVPEKPEEVPQPETVREEPAPVQTPDVQFSAPLISTLEKGKYYLQLRAYSRTDMVQSELNRLGSAYPLAVQAGGSPEKPLYRILVGPVNLGESNALLRRFKGNGYNDAFVKQAE